jgi:hypothetical protein
MRVSQTMMLHATILWPEVADTAFVMAYGHSSYRHLVQSRPQS